MTSARIDHSKKEELFAQLLAADGTLLPIKALQAVVDFVAHGEYGLAYEVFAFEFDGRRYCPSQTGLQLITEIGKEMGLTFPQKCY